MTLACRLFLICPNTNLARFMSSRSPSRARRSCKTTKLSIYRRDRTSWTSRTRGWCSSVFFRCVTPWSKKLNDIDYIFAKPDQFEDVAGFDLVTMESDVTNALNELTQNASTCVNNPKDCHFIP